MELKSVSGVPFRPVSEGLEDACPMCGTVGHRVMKVTVSNHVEDKYWAFLRSDWYRFCPNGKCDMVYYDNATRTYFLRGEVKTRVFQKGAPIGRYATACQ